MEFNVARQERPVQVVTAFGTIEGRIRCSPSIRTLDDLNLPGAAYLVIHEPAGSGVGMSAAPAQSPLAVQKEAILFARELQGAPPPPRRAGAEKFWRSVVEYRVAQYFLRGTVHIQPGGEPISRLNQRTHLFLALTSASVEGPGLSLEVPFLAVNRLHILSARELDGVAESCAAGGSAETATGDRGFLAEGRV